MHYVEKLKLEEH